jgi:hypothetical protein
MPELEKKQASNAREVFCACRSFPNSNEIKWSCQMNLDLLISNQKQGKLITSFIEEGLQRTLRRGSVEVLAEWE